MSDGSAVSVARILVLSSRYPPHHEGGYELSCRDVVSRWRARGHDVTVLTSACRRTGVGDPPDEMAAGVRRELSLARLDGAHQPSPWRLRRIELANHAALRSLLAETQPDVVSIWHMGSISTGLLTTLAAADVPLVYVVCDDWPTYAHRIDPWMRLFFRWPRAARVAERWTGVPATLPDIGASGTFCFISRNTRDRCSQRSPWTFPDSTVTYNGIDSETFPIANCVPDRAWAWKLVAAGRVSPGKGLETAVRALPLLPREATLEIFPTGESAHQFHLESVARALGVAERLRFTMTTRPELREHYRAADVCVFPPEWDEPFGLVPLEAMACGTPVVATASGGSGEFLTGGENCLTFPRRDHAALAAAVRRLAGDPPLRARLIVNGFRTAGELTADRLAEVLEAWHLAAAERFRGGRPEERAPLSR